jgi:hypothetical protein
MNNKLLISFMMIAFCGGGGIEGAAPKIEVGLGQPCGGFLHPQNKCAFGLMCTLNNISKFSLANIQPLSINVIELSLNFQKWQVAAHMPSTIKCARINWDCTCCASQA